MSTATAAPSASVDAPLPVGRDRRRMALAAAFGAGVLSLTGAGVYAALTATAGNTADAQEVASGTLSLTLGAGNAATLGQGTGQLAPGDLVRRHVTLTNGGTLAARNLGLQVGVANASSPTLAQNLTVTVRACSVAWTAATGVCGGDALEYLPATGVPALAAKAPFTASAAPVDMAVNGVVHLQVELALSGTEVTENGAPPAQTMQGQTAELTYTFSVDQRAGQATSS